MKTLGIAVRMQTGRNAHPDGIAVRMQKVETANQEGIAVRMQACNYGQSSGFGRGTTKLSTGVLAFRVRVIHKHHSVALKKLLAKQPIRY